MLTSIVLAPPALGKVVYCSRGFAVMVQAVSCQNPEPPPESQAVAPDGGLRQRCQGIKPLAM